MSTLRTAQSRIHGRCDYRVWSLRRGASKPAASRGCCRSDGFTLVEVLVALLVLSIGLLGVGKLVLFSSQANDSAYFRSQATALAYSIMDAMRANRTTALDLVSYAGSSAAATYPGTPCNMASPCTGGTLMAQSDMYAWQQSILKALGPSAVGNVALATTTDPTTNGPCVTVTVTVSWNDTVALQTLNGGASGNGTITLETIL